MAERKRGMNVSPLVELSKIILESIEKETSLKTTPSPTPTPGRPTPRPLKEQIR